MSPAEALHTAARRYLQQQYNYWAGRYARERSGHTDTYSDSDYNLYPRYNVLAAILGEVERLTGRAGGNIETLRAQLRQMGAEAQSLLTGGDHNSIEEEAMREERERFIAWLDSVDDSSLADVAALPYRRRLSEEEREALRGILYERWGYAGDYWEPLEGLSPQPVCWVLQQYLSDEDRAQLEMFIRTLAGARCYELTEDGIDAEIDNSLVDTRNEEMFYCDAAAEWIVYVSHEGTLAVGSDALISSLRDLFAGREGLLNRWPEE
ncbi:hypothetical protein EPD60_03000 [Flaviaesturariibacter flavus]|uniref:Uncharacterized protein n=1 Tax=Flaviaesturariibacter flavus TaxID=2502780 RepID=A0A4V2NWU8_9BACT|nr:hypothetical protein [Flaviaesturariibacter flavus]TCJ18742.1 hypothetical protein EPD60_03000 [Flaviaesturariibacter flavus]